MIDVTSSEILNRPAPEVFAFMANFENAAQWETDFVTVRRVSQGSNGVDTVYQYVRKVPGRTVESTFEITEFEPERRVAWLGAPAGGVQPMGSYTFEPVEGGTKVTINAQPKMLGLMRLLEPLMAGQIKKGAEAQLRRLKTIL